MYMYAAISLANAVLPALYYNVSSDYEGTQRDRNDRDESDNEADDDENLEIIKREKNLKAPKVKQGGGGRRNRDGNRRKRGNQDDNIWGSIAEVHSTIGGLSVMFFGLS